MISDDDKRFYELLCKQAIHSKLKDALAKKPDRVYDRKDLVREPEKIEEKYEEYLGVIKKRKK